MAVKTALDLVNYVRDFIQQPPGAQTPYRDGFAADATDSITGQPATATPILRYLNKAKDELLETGYCKCLYSVPLVVGQAEYQLDAKIHEILHATINGVPLRQTTLLKRDLDNPGWQTYPGLVTVGAGASPVRLSLPSLVYTYSDIVGVDPAPDQAYVLVMLCDDLAPDLVNTGDFFARVPARYLAGLASRAAWWISSMDIENTAAAARMPGLDADWQRTFVGVQKIVQERQWDADDQVEAGDYRGFFRRGGY